MLKYHRPADAHSTTPQERADAFDALTDLFLGEDWLEGQSILASNGPLHGPVLERLDPVRPDPWVRRPAGA